MLNLGLQRDESGISFPRIYKNTQLGNNVRPEGGSAMSGMAQNTSWPILWKRNSFEATWEKKTDYTNVCTYIPGAGEGKIAEGLGQRPTKQRRSTAVV